VSIYPKEIFKASERWLKKRYINLKYFNVLDSGGHFAALEKPELYIQEIRNFFNAF
jgi:pimeloyl-ACP methyl ester carboxylesterase